MITQRTEKIILGLLSAFLVLSLSECDGTNQPSGPDPAVLQKTTEDLPTSEIARAADSLLLRVCEREDGEIGKSKARVGLAGGTLSRADHHLTIPAGALDRTVGIRFIIPPTDYLECRLEPHGLEFNLPVSLVFSYDGICWDDDDSGDDDDLEESDFKVAYFNPDTEVWEPIPTAVDTVLNTATGSLEGIVGFTNHFSRYGIIKR